MKQPSKPDFQPEEIRFAEECGALGSSCPTPEVILAAQGEALPVNVRASVNEHISGCSLCAILMRDLMDPDFLQSTAVEQERIHDRVFGGIEAPEQSHRSKRRVLWLLVPAAATVLIIAGIYGFFLEAPAPPAQPASSDAQPADSPAESGLEALLVLGKPPVRLEASRALLFRSPGNSRQDSFLADLAPALDFYRADDFQRAADAFEQVAQKHPNAPEPFFYLGVSRLFLGEADQAVPALRKSRELGSEALNRDIAWYFGIAEFRRQRSEAAEAEFRRLCDEPGEHRDKACEVVNELSKVLK
jgi:hypothetical protein